MIHSYQDNTIHWLLTKKTFRFLRHLIFITTIGIITLSFVWYAPTRESFEYYRFYAWGIYSFVFGVIMYANIYLSVPRLLLKDKYTKYTISLAISVVAIILNIIITQVFLTQNTSLDKFNLLSFLINISSASIILTLLLLGSSSIALIKHWILADMRKLELESSALQSELKLLKNQINPHFLFNMLNNVNGLLKKDQEQASDTLFKLEDLLRYQIHETPKENVLLGAEIDFLEDYLKLEKLRRDNFEYCINTEHNCRSLEVSPLIFIVFVENAVKHNSYDENISYVRISFSYKEQELVFICENSKGHIYRQEQAPNGLGMKNIKRRLKLLYPDLHRIEVKEDNFKYIVKLTINI